jgi:hypothetical protein
VNYTLRECPKFDDQMGSLPCLSHGKPTTSSSTILATSCLYKRLVSPASRPLLIFLMHYSTILLAIFTAGSVSVGAFPQNGPGSDCVPLNSKCKYDVATKKPISPFCCPNLNQDKTGIYVSLAVLSIHSYVALHCQALFFLISAIPPPSHVK